jgi:hypothetical protein
VAAVLAIVAVVLIGLSIMLRPDASRVRVEVEDMMFEEFDVLRDDVREEITAAARATHKAFAERLQQVQETVEALRGQLEVARAGGYPVASAKAAPAPPTGRPAGNHSVGTAMVGGGVVRHTETVQVTTRQTIVDPHADGDRSGTVYGNGGGTVYGAAPRPAEPVGVTPGVRRSAEPADEPTTDRRGGWPPPREESWTEQRLRERMAEVRDSASRERETPDREDVRSDAGGRGFRAFDRDDDRSPDAGDDPRWTDLRAGDRWASVRSDERGRELRMGERRAAVHSDGTGTELRIEDRWAQVRREDARHRGERWEPDPASSSDESTNWSQAANWDSRGTATPALPAAPAEPASSWTQSWRDDREREREPVRRRREDDRDGRWEREDTGRGQARPRRPEFELNDERWR